MRVASNSNTTCVARRILASFKEGTPVVLEAVGPKALVKAVLAVEKAQAWQCETYPVEHLNAPTEIDGEEKTVHKMMVYR